MDKDNKNQIISRAFAGQAEFCASQKAPVTAAIIAGAQRDFDAGGIVHYLLSGWSGHPVDDALALRLAGFLHFQALSGAAPELAAFYPSCGGQMQAGQQAALWRLAEAELHSQQDAVRKFLRHPPQTNETGRAAVLLAGFSEIARQTDLPLRLREIGSSAGLNLLFDHYHYNTGQSQWGPPDALLSIDSDWQGTPPVLLADIPIADRRGCDVAPIDLADASHVLRLQSYVWGDMQQRRERLLRALTVFQAAQKSGIAPVIDRANAAGWVASQVMQRPVGQTTVLFHSITWQYLDVSQRMSIESAMAQAFETASPEAPLAWLRMDVDRGAHIPVLEYDISTGGAPQKIRLASCHPHGMSAEFSDAL
jgi:hypothetical protein